MPSRTSNLSSDKKYQIILNALEDKKVVNPEVISLQGKSLIADYFVLCTGTSDIHIRSLADGVVEAMENKAGQSARREGENSSDWVLLDYGDVVVHIFSADAREMYDLESLWRSTEAARDS